MGLPRLVFSTEITAVLFKCQNSMGCFAGSVTADGVSGTIPLWMQRLLKQTAEETDGSHLYLQVKRGQKNSIGLQQSVMFLNVLTGPFWFCRGYFLLVGWFVCLCFTLGN